MVSVTLKNLSWTAIHGMQARYLRRWQKLTHELILKTQPSAISTGTLLVMRYGPTINAVDGVVRFDAEVSSQACCDDLHFCIDCEQQLALSACQATLRTRFLRCH